MNYMLVTNYFLIGNMSVPSSWIALIIAFVLSYSGIRLRFGRHAADLLADLIFTFIIVWKLSVIVTDFETVIHSPLSILYFHGGRVGIFLGLIVAIIKVFIEIKKQKLVKDRVIALFVGSVLIQSTYQVLMVLLNDGAVIAQVVTVIAFISFAISIWFSIAKTEGLLSGMALLFIVIHLFTSSFQPAGLFGTSVIVTVIMGSFFAIVLSERFIKEL